MFKWYKLVSHHYDVLVVPKENSTDALEVSYTAKPLHRNRTDTSGGYIFRRSHVGRSIESVVMQYHKLNDIEHTFGTLKTDLKVRPIVYQKDHGIKAPIFIIVLAYYGVHMIRRKLKTRGIDDSWRTIQRELNKWQRGDVVLEKTNYAYTR
ncbi:MAG: hypothetical protein OXC03_11185 [Flavobacteriaceae bacterium]|nr:hypothetical protein [Flavobacteriaceae bacterium]